MRRIPFMRDMMLAVRADDKTQTRRVIDTQKDWPVAHTATLDASGARPVAIMRWHSGARQDVRLPYAVGDTLLVIEDWKVSAGHDAFKPSEIHPGVAVHYMADGSTSTGEPIAMLGRRRWSQHMPEWASREKIKVTDLRLQRLQDISGDDMMAEGVVENWEVVDIVGTPNGPSEISDYRFRVNGMHDDEEGFEDLTDAFTDLWDRINLARGFGWARNPWVAAYTFERLRA